MPTDIFLIYPIHLFKKIKNLENKLVYLIEEKHYFDRYNDGYKFNILKPIYHHLTMQNYYKYLQNNNINCKYIKVDEYITLPIHNNIYCYDVVDHYLQEKIQKKYKNIIILDSPAFLLTNEQLYDGVYKQTSFYIWIRKLLNILINNKTKKFIGNKVSYDKENRERPPKDILKKLKHETPNVSQDEFDNAKKYILNKLPKNHFIDSNNQVIKFPTDHKTTKKRLTDWIEHRFKYFGKYQDIIIDTNHENSFIYHSGLSVMLNIGLITPNEIIDAVIKKNMDIATTEGFIRQLIGWREFARLMYIKFAKNYKLKNYFNANKLLNDKWYGHSEGIGIKPVDECINKAFKFGYLHHIERLMVIANYMVLSEIHPDEIYKWFMEFSLDSYDWVMFFNIYSMATYSDGGEHTTKPYISSDKYISKMSNWKNDGVWNVDWNNKFWNFLKKHKSKISKIPRLMQLTNLI